MRIDRIGPETIVRRPRSILAASVLATLFTVGCPGERSSGTAVESRRSVLLIVVDTLRADHLTAYGHPRDTSPHLTAWASTGRLYERALATSPWTAPTFGSIFTGGLPSCHGAMRQERPDGSVRFGSLDPGVVSLAEHLSRLGYRTAAMVNNPFLSPEFGLDRGFDLYDYEPGNNLSNRSATEMVDRALAWIDQQGDDPFFLVLHLFDPHMSYDPPAPFRGRFTSAMPSRLSLPIDDLNGIRSGAVTLDAADRAFIAAAYDEEIAYVDGELGRLQGELTRRRFPERGWTILTSDHGEELFEHGGFEHGHAMWQELLHVPLVIWGDGIPPGREPVAVSLVDLAPTVLELVGAPAESSAMDGRSLAGNLLDGEALAPLPLFAEHNLYGSELKVALHWPYKWIVNTASGEGFLFDLDANPAEELISPTGAEAIRRELQQALTRRVEGCLAARVEAPPADVGEETLERLRSLGYVN